ncbi:MAG TPA: LuxR C-terminal-related transcriptional regulator [Bacteroidales bacterium]|nr:LuxR C-terminal-related transcriptional regulator [Bacteroidales bacterium]
MMDENNQYLSVFDVLRMKTLFVSQGSIKFLGVKPEDLIPYHFKEATHPDDLKRQELGLVQLFKIAHELFVAKNGEMLLSSNFRMRMPNGNYTNQLVQCYLYYSQDHNNTVYMIDIKTDISWHKKIRHGFHYYMGNDPSYFRYPDEELLMTGNIFSDREFEIIKLVQQGFDSEQIADKLFLSKHTVHTHRKNILDKSGKAHISELIYDLHERGLL